MGFDARVIQKSPPAVAKKGTKFIHETDLVQSFSSLDKGYIRLLSLLVTDPVEQQAFPAMSSDIHGYPSLSSTMTT